MSKSYKYNLNYIGGIEAYRKRAMYTLNIKDDSFSVDGLFKSQHFSYDDIVDIKYGEIDLLKENTEIVRLMLFDQVSLLNWKNNKRINYCLVIVLKDQTILFAEEYEVSIAKAYQRLLDSVNKTRKVRS